MDENILLKTIKVPKKLLSLTNRLPEPAYNIKEEQKCNSHTTMSTYLPELKIKYIPKKLHAILRNNTRKRIIKNPNINEIYISRINPENIKHHKTISIEQDEVNELAELDKENPKNNNKKKKKIKLNIPPVEFNQERYIINKNDSDIKYNEPNPKINIEAYKDDINDNLNPIKKQIKELKFEYNDYESNADNIDYKHNMLKIIRDKYLRRQNMIKQSLESNKNQISKSYIKSNKDVSIFIKQFFNRKHPQSKSNNNSMQIGFNYYSNNSHNSLPIRKLKQSIDNLSISAKYNEHNILAVNREINKKLRLKPLIESYGRNQRKQQLILSKSKLDSVNLTSCDKDLQVFEIKPQPLYSSIKK